MATAQPIAPDAELLASTVSELLGFTAQQQQDVEEATGSEYAAEGAGIENQLYTEAGNVAGQNAAVAEMAGQVQQKQILQSAMSTISAQQATVAASGFRQTGSALAQLRASVMQTHLAQSIAAAQANEQASGYSAQQYTANLEAQGASVQQQADVALQAQQNQAAMTAQTNAANETKALIQYEQATNASSSPAAQFATQVLAGNPITAPATLTIPTAAEAQQQAVQQFEEYQISEGVPTSTIQMNAQNIQNTTQLQQQETDQQYAALGLTPPSQSGLAQEFQNTSNPAGYVTINGVTVNTAASALQPVPSQPAPVTYDTAGLATNNSLPGV